jgi:subtilisin family serine protease
MIMPTLLKLALRREPTEEELDTYSAYFVNQAVEASKAMPNAAKDTLFVIAAGNDGMNNDVLPTSPANLRMPNTITVAATLAYQKIASFSNYGETMVDVAAPGVGILSAIPGNQTLTVSGTSQASPFVANVAALLTDANPNLSNSDLKKILMETSDIKDFLKGKVASSGIVNTDRAMMAAKLSLTMQLDQALSSARVQINDVSTQSFSNVKAADEAFVLPLPSLL